MKNYNYIGVGFGPKVFTHRFGVNAHFNLRRKNRPLTKPNN